MADFQPSVHRYYVPRGNSIPPPFKASDGQGFQRGVKRKGFHLLANIPAKQPVQRFFCDLCHIQLNSIQQAEQHKYGKIHQNKAKVLAQLTSNGVKSMNKPVAGTQEPITPTPLQAKNKNCGVSLNCIICQKVFNSTTQAEQHFKSQMHHHKIQGIVEGRLAPIEVTSLATSEDTVTSSKVTMVQASKTTVTSEVTVLQLQVAPRALEPSLTASAMKQGDERFPASENGNKVASVTMKTFYCETCHVASNSKSQYQLHIQGARHKNKICKTMVNSKKQPQAEKHVAIPAGVTPESGVSPINKPNMSSANSTKGRSSPIPFMFYCEDCETSFNSQKQLVQHMTSAKHMKKAQRKQSSTPSNFKGTWKKREKGRGQGIGRGGVSRGKSNVGSSGSPGVVLNATSAPPPLLSSFIGGT